MAGFELYAPREASHRRTWTAGVILLGLGIALLAGLVAAIPDIVKMVAHMAEATAQHQPPKIAPMQGSVWLEIVNYVVFIGLILLWVKAFERRWPTTIGFNGQGLMRFLRGYLVGAAFLVAVVGAIWGLGGYQIESQGFWAKPALAGFGTVLVYMLLFIVQGSSEEVWMRGWLMQIVASRHGIVLAVVINSLVFGALHLTNLFFIPPSPANYAGVVNVALFGVFISLYAVKERSIWGVCGWHAAWNWLLGVGFGLEVSGLKLTVPPLVVDLMDSPKAAWWLTGGTWGPEGSVIATLVLAIGIAWLVWRGALKPGESFPVPIADKIESVFQP